jgi:hypothetical protein
MESGLRSGQRALTTAAVRPRACCVIVADPNLNLNLDVERREEAHHLTIESQVRAFVIEEPDERSRRRSIRVVPASVSF